MSASTRPMQPRSSPATWMVTKAPRGSSSDWRCGAPGGMKPVVRYSRKVARAMRSSSLALSCRSSSGRRELAARSSRHRRPRAVLPIAAVVVEDLRVIERQRRQRVERVDAARSWRRRRRAACPSRAAEEHHRDGRAARIALRIGVGEELLGRASTSSEVSSFASRTAACASDSPTSTKPPGSAQPCGGFLRSMSTIPPGDLDDDVDGAERRQPAFRSSVGLPSQQRLQLASRARVASPALARRARLCCSVGSAVRSYSSVVFSLSF